MGQSMKKQSKLQEAIDEGETALPDVATLLDVGLSANTKIGHATALYYAIYKRQRRIAELLLERGASVSSGYFTETPLHEAAAVGDVRILSMLLSRGAKINAKNHNGCTPLWYAVKERHLDAAQYLLQQAGVDIDCPCDDTFLKSTALTTSLSLAVQNEDVDMVHLLLSEGADLNAADVSGHRKRSWMRGRWKSRTPLHHACQLKNVTLAEMLVQHGCLLDVTDSYGYTPVHTAVSHESPAIIRLLVQAGCDVNLGKLGSNWHPLHTASDLGNPVMVAILCSAKNVDVNCRDKHLKTPLIVACRSGSIDCIQYLLVSGADVNVKDGNGLTVLSLALSLEEEPSLIWRLSGLQKKSRGHLAYCCHCHKSRCSGDHCHGDESECGGGHCHGNKNGLGGSCNSDKEECDQVCCHGNSGNCDRKSHADKLCSNCQSQCKCSFVDGSNLSSKSESSCGHRVLQGQENNHLHFDGCEDHLSVTHHVRCDFEVHTDTPCSTLSCSQHPPRSCAEDAASIDGLETNSAASTLVENVASTCSMNNNISKRPSEVAATASSMDVLHVLIQAGANLNLKDEYGKTALDYAFQVLKLQSACLLLCHGAALDRETLISVVHASRIRLPPRKFIRPAVVALTLTSFDFWNCLHHFFYRPDFFDDDCALTEIMLKLQQPMSLARQSRSVIRQTLTKNTNTSIAPLVKKLPLPNALKQFLLLSDVVEIVCSGNFC